MVTQNNPFGTNGAWDARSSAYRYPNPFCDIASVYIPTNLDDAMTWMEYLMLTMPPFMSVVNRVVSYFLTDIDIHNVADKVRDNYERVFDKELHMIQRLQDIGKDYFCFAGDTDVQTSEGLRKISDLAKSGKEVEVCGIDGQWHKTTFKSFGVQKTKELSFGTGLTVRVTGDHKWWVDTRDGGDNLSYLTTDQLKCWYKVPFVHIPRPDGYTQDFKKGSVHGASLGSTPRSPKWKEEYAESLKKAFRLGKEEFPCLRVPPLDVSRDYWFGVFAGMAETCGYFQKKTRYFFLTHSDKSVLEACKRGFESAGFVVKAMVARKVWGGEIRYYLPFNCQYLEETDFIGEDTREKFRAVMENAPAPRLYTLARPGKGKARREEVFCCVEPETHTFALKGGVITGNCYGNSFVSLYLPFDRYLICPDCHSEIHISQIKYTFKPETGEFICSCPGCKQGKKVFEHKDRRLHDTSKVQVIRWNPKRIRLKVHPITGQIKYYYEIEPKFVQRIREGDPFYLNTTPWGFVETCIGKGNSRKDAEYLFEFAEDQIYHMRDTVFAGLSDKIRGWAIPPLLPYFKLAYYIQLMRRYDEAIALDFIMPFRILYPQGNAPGGQDALTMVSMQTFIAAMSQMVEKKRMNMTSIEVAPYAIGYELIGGEAKQLAPKESIQQAEQELLNAMGFPQELFAGTLTLQAAPVALRLFEREWNPLVDSMNTVLQWMTDQISKYFMWDPAEVSLTPVTLADDMERKGMQLQAAAAQDVSKQTAYRSIGIDYMKEQERIIQEQQDVQKLQQKAMADAQAEQANGATGGGGEGGEGGGGGMNGPGGQVGATPGDIFQQAQEIARQLVMANNPTQSRQTLASVEQTNPTLYAMVKQQMQELRQQLSSQGREQMIAQMNQQQ